MRVTMGMIQQRYKSNLNSSKNIYEKYSLRATTTRSFDKPSDDPLNCARSYDVQWGITMNSTYQSNIDTIEDAQNTADTTIESMYTSLNSTIKKQIEGITGSSSQSVRDTLANTLLSTRDSLVTDMNTAVAGKYLFAGASSDSAPFTVDSDGNLLYRGINVNTGENTNGASETITNTSSDKSIQINFGKSIGTKLDGYQIEVTAGSGTANTVNIDTTSQKISITMKKDATKGDLQSELQSNDFLTKLQNSGDDNLNSVTDVSGISVTGMTYDSEDKLDLSGSYKDSSTDHITNIVSLKDLANEKVYVDIGIGLTNDSDGSVDDQSAYNTSMPGISFLGYGKNENNVDENLYSLLGDMASVLKDSSLTNQNLIDKFTPYSNSYSNSLNNLYTQHSTLGTNITSLKSTATYLSGLNTNLVTEESSIASVSPFEAITDFSQQVYYYTAALQVGSKLLQPTLIDYMS